jgi:transcription elongation factor Elf1
MGEGQEVEGVMTANNDTESELPPAMHKKIFTCPLCGQQTGVETPLDFIFTKWATCEKCGREFLIENDQPRATA